MGSEWHWAIAGAGIGQPGSPERKNAPENFSRALRRWCRNSGGAGLHCIYPANRLAVPLAQKAELGLLFGTQIFIPLRDITHGIVEPVLLMLREGIDDAAAEDMTEHLVTGLGKGHRIRFTPEFLLSHLPSLLAARKAAPWGLWLIEV